MATIIQIALSTPTSVPVQEVADASWLLRAFVAFPDRRVLAFGAPGFKKNAGDRLFNQLHADERGRFTIELGAVLAERLPLAEGQSEAALTVARTTAERARFCLSNAMLRLHYRKGDTDRHALCPVYALSTSLADQPDEFSAPPHVEYIPTVVTARYAIEGPNADSALADHLEAIVDDFIAGINRIVSSTIVSIDPTKLNVLAPVYDRGSFPWVYLLIRGDGDAFDAHLVSANLLRSTLVQQPLDADRWASFRSIVDGTDEIDVAVKSAQTAHSYIQAGSYDFALLLAAIAAEVATTRYVHARLQQEGVPKKRVENVERDLTFSMMLNTQLTVLAPVGMKPDAELLTQIDTLRKYRNELMHEGGCGAGRLDIVAMVSAADRFVTYIRTLEMQPSRF